MRNSIFKSYTKKILRSEAFISVIIVFVLALGIIGTSYALYMDIDTDTNYQLVEVGDLSIGFDNGENTITLENMTPMEDELALKESGNIFSFYIYNTGTYTADYEIKLVPDNTNGNTIAPEYINYQICKDNAENCTDIKTLGTNSLIYTDALSPKRETDASNPSAYYFLRLWINNQYTETSGGTIKYNVEISAKNSSGYLDNDNTLAGAILNNPNITINNTIPKFNEIADYKVTGDATSGELGLFKAEDDYGVSYYFRGAQSNNYVNFAGFTWRVVRINGDGSIRIILDGTLSNVKREGLNTYAGSNSYFNEFNNDNAYVGYMYGQFEGNSTSYEEAHDNIVDSAVKKEVDKFYETYIENEKNNYHYSKYISDTIFCADKTPSSDKCYGTNECYYNSNDRILSPTFECAKGDSYDYSRFTVDVYTTEKGVVTNGDLKYPIALLTIDEAVFSGLIFGQYNTTNFLHSVKGWLLTPRQFTSSMSSNFLKLQSYPLWSNSSNNQSTYVSPVINLKKDVLISGGNGTQSTPYTINYN